MKKWIVCALALLLAIMPLAGCAANGSSVPAASSAGGESGTATPEGEGATVTWLALNTWENYLTPVLERYKELTGVTVKPEYYAFNDLFEVIEVKVASGSADYDIIAVDVPMVAAYATRGYIKPMDEYVTAEDKEGWIPSAVAAGSWQGTMYAPPLNSSSQLLWYNIDLLAEGGVTVRESSVDNRLTYEEVDEYAKTALAKLDPDGNQGIAGVVFQQVSRTYQMCALPNSMGGKNIGDDGFTVDGVINDDAWVNSLTWYQNNINEGLDLRGYNGEETGPNFNAGKVLFMIGGTWTPGNIPDTNYGFAPVPTFEGFDDKVGTPTGSWHLGINQASTQPDLAFDFIKFMSLGEGNDMWLAATGEVPATTHALDAIVNDPNADPIQQIAAFEAANTAVPRALTPGYSEYSSIMDATFEDIRNGADVKGALDSAVEQINSAFEKYKS